MSDLVYTLSKGEGETKQSTQTHDLVGRWIGGNKPTTDFTGGSMFKNSHGSYTLGWVPVGTWIDDGKGAQIDIGTVIRDNWGDGHYSKPELVLPTRMREKLKQQTSSGEN